MGKISAFFLNEKKNGSSLNIFPSLSKKRAKISPYISLRQGYHCELIKNWAKKEFQRGLKGVYAKFQVILHANMAVLNVCNFEI